MKVARTHYSKKVLIRFRDGEYFEEWSVRFNRGSKLKNPVKFFARECWRSDNSIRLVPFAATSGSYANEKEAMNFFLTEIQAIDGAVLEITSRLRKLIMEKFGHEIVDLKARP
jgi:hypothetical protein